MLNADGPPSAHYQSFSVVDFQRFVFPAGGRWFVSFQGERLSPLIATAVHPTPSPAEISSVVMTDIRKRKIARVARTVHTSDGKMIELITGISMAQAPTATLRTCANKTCRPNQTA